MRTVCKADKIVAQIQQLRKELLHVQHQYKCFNEVREALRTLTRNDWELPDGAEEALQQMADEIDEQMNDFIKSFK